MRRTAVFAAIAALSLSASLAACATAHDAKADGASGGPTDLTLPAGDPAPPQARLYADCISQSVATGSFDRAGGFIRFRCDGAPARAFYDGLAAWSAKIGSEITVDGRTWRATQKVHKDLSGLDYCWHAPTANPAYGCTTVFNAGDFIRE